MALVEIADFDAAQELQKKCASKNTGIFIVSDSLSRGFDLKLAVDGYVMMLVEGRGYDLTQVRQMLGRGSRAQGTCTGAIFTNEFGRADKEDIEQLLANKEPKFYHGPQLCRKFYEQWTRFDASQKQYVREAFKAGKWRKTMTDLREEDRALGELLNGNLKFPLPAKKI